MPLHTLHAFPEEQNLPLNFNMYPTLISLISFSRSQFLSMALRFCGSLFITRCLEKSSKTYKKRSVWDNKENIRGVFRGAVHIVRTHENVKNWIPPSSHVRNRTLYDWPSSPPCKYVLSFHLPPGKIKNPLNRTQNRSFTIGGSFAISNCK